MTWWKPSATTTGVAKQIAVYGGGSPTRSASVLETFLRTRYAFSVVVAGPAGGSVAVSLVRGAYSTQFLVPADVINAGFLTACTFAGDKAEAFIREADAGTYGYRLAEPEVRLAPRSAVCPCGIDRRDCEYHS